MNIYISSHDQDEARSLADFLTENDHTVVSKWVYETGKPISEFTDNEKALKAYRNCRQIDRADALVLIESETLVSGGKFVEAGYALALGLPVFIYGESRENVLLHHPEVTVTPSRDFLLEALEEEEV